MDVVALAHWVLRTPLPRSSRVATSIHVQNCFVQTDTVVFKFRWRFGPGRRRAPFNWTLFAALRDQLTIPSCFCRKNMISDSSVLEFALTFWAEQLIARMPLAQFLLNESLPDKEPTSRKAVPKRSSTPAVLASRLYRHALRVQSGTAGPIGLNTTLVKSRHCVISIRGRGRPLRPAALPKSDRSASRAHESARLRNLVMYPGIVPTPLSRSEQTAGHQ